MLLIAPEERAILPTWLQLSDCKMLRAMLRMVVLIHALQYLQFSTYQWPTDTPTRIRTETIDTRGWYLCGSRFAECIGARRKSQRGIGKRECNTLRELQSTKRLAVWSSREARRGRMTTWSETLDGTGSRRNVTQHPACLPRVT